MLAADEWPDCLVSSGCRVIQCGVESGSDRVLEYVGKRITRAQVEAVNKSMAQYPIWMRYNFMIGFPGETRTEMEETVNLMGTLRRANPYAEPPFLNVYCPYPGTLLYQEAVESGFEPPRSLEGWADVSWNVADHHWRDKEDRAYMEVLSRRALEDSSYLKERLR
jgi:radical SAM superfamily enzyme YgiQ (UPF0313 family)